MFAVDLRHFLVLSSLLLALGLFGITGRKNLIGVLIGIELVFISASINFVAFSKYIAMDLSGQMFALFIFIVSVCETVVALAILLRMYQQKATVQIEETEDLKC